jgi:hypothetical protein
MPVDSLVLFSSAALLLAATIVMWIRAGALRSSARLNFRFAAMLVGTGAIAAPLSGLAEIVVLTILPLGCTALALAALARFVRRAPALPASLALSISLASGIGAVVTASPMLAAVPAALAAAVIAIVALQDFAWIAALAGVALLAAIFAFLQQGVGAGLLLFGAVALLGLSRSALGVEQPRDTRRNGFVSSLQ